MTTTLTPPPAAALEHLPPAAIDTVDRFNPRTAMDDGKLAELTASVARVGVIQPVIVTPADGERYTLVVGHRRLAAAKAANVETIPALVFEAIDDAARLQMAVIENLQREDINPIDEAAAFQRAITQHGLTQKQLADAVGKSASHISERLRLLKLPPEAQQHIATGKIPLSTVKVLAQIAKVSPAVADGCAHLVATGQAEADDLVSEPQYVVGMLCDVEWEDAPFIQPVRRHSGPIRLAPHIDETEIAKLDARAEALGVTRFAFDNEDIDAARAYKCLLELGDGYAAQQYVTDARFTYARLTLALDRAEAERSQALQASSDTNAGAEPAPENTDSGDAVVRAQRLADRQRAKEQAERRTERERADKARLEAITANRQLGLNLVKKLGSKKLDRDTAKLLALIVLAQNPDLAGRGIRLTHDEYHTLERIRHKSGKVRVKFTPADSADARDRLTKWVTRPKTPEEIIGRLLQALIAATFADDSAVAQSKRVHWHLPGRLTDRSVEQLTAKLAAKLVPGHFQQRVAAMLPTPPAATKPAAKRSPKTTPSKTGRSRDAA